MKCTTQQRHDRLHCAAKIRLGTKENFFFGPGTVELLQQIENTGSVRRASESMEMSYSKCWKLLSNIEEALGFPVVVCYQGGRGGGKARLTPEGNAFLNQYIAFEKDCQQAVAGIFREHFLT